MSADIGRNISFTWGGSSILGLREKGIAIAGEPVDVTSDEDSGWRTLLTVAGQNEISLSISGVTKDKTLIGDWFQGTRTKEAIITYPDGSTLTGDFYLSSYTDTGPYMDAITFDATLLSTGEVVFVEGV
jgi:predicted secreted protein